MLFVNCKCELWFISCELDAKQSESKYNTVLVFKYICCFFVVSQHHKHYNYQTTVDWLIPFFVQSHKALNDICADPNLLTAQNGANNDVSTSRGAFALFE